MTPKRILHPTERLSGQSKELFDVLNEGTDLAAVLIGTSFLDQCLGSLLRHKLADSTVTTRLLEPGRGLLGDFAARADLAYVLGLLRKPAYQDLLKIVEIRNHFAHSHLTVGFSDPIVVGLCDALSYEERLWDSPGSNPKRVSPRSRFCVTVAQLSQRLLVDALSLKIKKQ